MKCRVRRFSDLINDPMNFHLINTFVKEDY